MSDPMVFDCRVRSHYLLPAVDGVSIFSKDALLMVRVLLLSWLLFILNLFLPTAMKMYAPDTNLPIAHLPCTTRTCPPPTHPPTQSPWNLPCIFLAQKTNPAGKLTESAHPARFSPDDKFSGARVANKKRFGVLPTQQAPIVL